MAPKKVGPGTARDQGDVRSWRPDTGTVTHRRVEGEKEQVQAIFDLLKNFSSDVSEMNEERISHRKYGLDIIRADDPDGAGNNPADNSTWELLGNEFQVDVRNFPLYRNTNKVTRQDMVDIESRLASPNSVYTNTTRPDAQTLYEWLSRGTEYYIDSTPVIRQTVTKHRNNSNFEPDYDDVNRVVTLASIGAPNQILGALDDLTFVNADGDFTSGQFEWLKKMPILRITTKFGLSLVSEWWGARQWSKTFYDGTLLP